MRRDRIGNAFDARYLHLIGCLAALMMPSEVGAGALFSRSFAAGNGPTSIAVADLDGDTVPGLVTANLRGGVVSVLLGYGDGTFQAAAAVHPPRPMGRERGRCVHTECSLVTSSLETVLPGG